MFIVTETIDTGSEEELDLEGEAKKDRTKTQVLVNAANIVDQADQNMNRQQARSLHFLQSVSFHLM